MPSPDTLAEEFAPGIPKDRRVQPLPSISKPTDWKLAIQEHDAERAGKHFDFRLVDPATGHAHSWALPNAKMPEPGKSVLAVPQATHTATYALNFGKKKPQEIAEGYGKGMVSMHALTDVDVHHSDPAAEEGETRLRFNIYKSTGPEEYAIVKVRGGNDLLVNKTLTRERLPHLPIGEKPKAKDKDVSKIEFDNANEVMMPKYDGAHTLLDISRANKNLNLFSYREPKRHAAGLIEHTHKVPSLLALKAPSDLKGTTFRAETIAVDKDGKAIPAKDIAGMLNATVPASRAKQEQMGAELKPVIFDVVRYKGKDVTNKPFAERYELARQAGERLGLTVAELAKTPEEKRTLLEAIRAGKHPMTAEGVVLRSAIDDGPAIKAKFRPDYDVHVRGVFEAKDKSGAGKGRAGGFEYSWSEKGPVVGRIGTGLDHETARDMLVNPDKYIGRVAKVEAEQQYPSGALGKPAFMEWHLDKGDIEKAEKTAVFSPEIAERVLELAKPFMHEGAGLTAAYGVLSKKWRQFKGLESPPEAVAHYASRMRPSLPKITSLPEKEQVLALGGDLAEKLTPEQARMSYAINVGHELDELGAQPQRSFHGTFGHYSPDVVLREHNRLVTLPPGNDAVVDIQKKLREKREAVALKPWLEFGQGERLSRHARRRITEQLEAAANKARPQWWKTAGINDALSRLGLI
jgi:hypothetical protein